MNEWMNEVMNNLKIGGTHNAANFLKNKKLYSIALTFFTSVSNCCVS